MTRILIIEDDDAVADTLRQMLELDGFEVIVATNGAEGEKMFKKNSVDLIITDLLMPEKEGIETIKDIREISPDVKIIAMSGSAGMFTGEYLRAAKALGANSTLSKPISRGDLLQSVNKMIDSK